MYLVKMNDGDKIVETANEVRTLDKNKIIKIIQHIIRKTQNFFTER